MRCSRSLAAAAAALAFVALHSATAGAQMMNPSVHFGATGGLSIPLSSFSTTHQTGYYLSGFGEGTPSGSPFALRGEVSYSGYTKKPSGSADNILGLTANAVVALENARSGPYFIGGIGLYHLGAAGGFGPSQNDFGVNVGGGIKWQLADMSTFAEIGVHLVSSTGGSTQIIPITFGLVF
jgi:hypothetical protein